MYATEQKRALERGLNRSLEAGALATNQRKAKPPLETLLLDESPDALIATTTQGRVLYWNKGAESEPWVLLHENDTCFPRRAIA
jgi:hypothetical protein